MRQPSINAWRRVVGFAFVGMATHASPPPADEVNAASYAAGCRRIREDGEALSTGARNDPGWLLDGNAATNWETGTKDATRGVILRLAEAFELTSVEFVAATDKAETIRELLLQVGDGPQGPWRKLAQVTLNPGREPQRKQIEPTTTRFLRINFLSNYGHAGWWGLSDFRAFGRRASPRQVDFGGDFETRFGTMRLLQTGYRVMGCLDRGKNVTLTIDGAVHGTSMSGSWTETSGSAVRSGAIVLVLTADGDIAGLWSDSQDLKSIGNNRWDAKRLAKGNVACPQAQAPGAIEADLTQNGRVVLRGILFDTGKDIIKPESLPVLEELARVMKASAAKSYVIEGHTDDRAAADFNQRLSERRAAAIKAWLVETKVDGDRLSTVGFGLTRPAMSNDTEAGRAANRRVEVSLKP